MKIVAVFAVCAVLVGVASATPLPEDSTIVQLVNKVLSQSAEVQKQKQDAEEQSEQSMLSRLRSMAMLQDVLKDELKNSKQQDVKEQRIYKFPSSWGAPCVCKHLPCKCTWWG